MRDHRHVCVSLLHGHPGPCLSVVVRGWLSAASDPRDILGHAGCSVWCSGCGGLSFAVPALPVVRQLDPQKSWRDGGLFDKGEAGPAVVIAAHRAVPSCTRWARRRCWSGDPNCAAPLHRPKRLLAFSLAIAPGVQALSARPNSSGATDGSTRRCLRSMPCPGGLEDCSGDGSPPTAIHSRAAQVVSRALSSTRLATSAWNGSRQPDVRAISSATSGVSPSCSPATRPSAIGGSCSPATQSWPPPRSIGSCTAPPSSTSLARAIASREAAGTRSQRTGGAAGRPREHLDGPQEDRILDSLRGQFLMLVDSGPHSVTHGAVLVTADSRSCAAGGALTAAHSPPVPVPARSIRSRRLARSAWPRGPRAAASPSAGRSGEAESS